MADGRTKPQKGNTSSPSGGGTVDKIEAAAWLQLDLADYLRLPSPMSIVDKQERDLLRKRIIRQLKQQEQAGDPLQVVNPIRQLMADGESLALDQQSAT